MDHRGPNSPVAHRLPPDAPQPLVRGPCPASGPAVPRHPRRPSPFLPSHDVDATTAAVPRVVGAPHAREFDALAGSRHKSNAPTTLPHRLLVDSSSLPRLLSPVDLARCVSPMSLSPRRRSGSGAAVASAVRVPRRFTFDVPPLAPSSPTCSPFTPPTSPPPCHHPGPFHRSSPHSSSSSARPPLPAKPPLAGAAKTAAGAAKESTSTSASSGLSRLSWVTGHLQSWLGLKVGSAAARPSAVLPGLPRNRRRPSTPHPRVQRTAAAGRKRLSPPSPPLRLPLSGDASPSFAFSRFVSPSVAPAAAKGRGGVGALPSPSSRTASASPHRSRRRLAGAFHGSRAGQPCGPHPPSHVHATYGPSSDDSSPHSRTPPRLQSTPEASPSSAPLSPLSVTPVPFTPSASSPRSPSSPESRSEAGAGSGCEAVDHGCGCGSTAFSYPPPLFIPGGGSAADVATIAVLPPSPRRLPPWRLSFGDCTREVEGSGGVAPVAGGRSTDWAAESEDGGGWWLGRLTAQSPPPFGRCPFARSPLWDGRMDRRDSGAEGWREGERQWQRDWRPERGGAGPLPFPSLLPLTQQSA